MPSEFTMMKIPFYIYLSLKKVSRSIVFSLKMLNFFEYLVAPFNLEKLKQIFEKYMQA